MEDSALLMKSVGKAKDPGTRFSFKSKIMTKPLRRKLSRKKRFRLKHED